MKKFTNKDLTKIIPPIITILIFVVGISITSINTETVKKSDADSIQVQYMHPVYAANFADDRVLVGASHHVFTGKVLEQIGTKERDIGPETQFKVEVIDNVKGELKDTVVINQQGGFKDGILYVMEDANDVLTKGKKNSYLLQPGSTYLFATRYNEKENWYTLNSYPTALRIISDRPLSSEKLKTLSSNNQRVAEIREAYSREIHLNADINNDNIRNSYQFAKEMEEEKLNEEAIQEENVESTEESGSTEEAISE